MHSSEGCAWCFIKNGEVSPGPEAQFQEPRLTHSSLALRVPFCQTRTVLSGIQP